MTIHDFHKDLKDSHSNSEQKMWEYIYRIYFHDFQNMSSIIDSLKLQRLGVDRIITLKSEKEILIDEKIRRSDYGKGDILLEYLSNDSTGALGWIEKTLRCDYIAYAILPTRQCWILPVPQLQGAWKANKERWLAKYDLPPAQNDGYKTYSCGVPADVLLFAIYRNMCVDYSEVDPLPPKLEYNEWLERIKKLNNKKN